MFILGLSRLPAGWDICMGEAFFTGTSNPESECVLIGRRGAGPMLLGR